MENILEVKNLSVSIYSAIEVLHPVRNISFSIQSGETVGLVGASGSGKSLTLGAILGLLRQGISVSHGKIEYQGIDLLKISERDICKIRGREIATVFQNSGSIFNPVLTIGQQMEEVLSIHHPELSVVQKKSRVLEVLTELGLPQPEKRYEDYPHEMSGGMRQRVLIGIAALCRPKLILADEPTSALDLNLQWQVLELFDSWKKSFGLATLFVSHDLDTVARICDRVLVMNEGEIVESGRVNEIFESPTHAYTKSLLSSRTSLL